MTQNREYDVFKDTWLRYLGYANEVGEAFRAVVPVSAVRLSYVVASTYVAVDSLDKGIKQWKKSGKSDKIIKSGIAAMDTLVWQGFASVIIPGFTINRICWLTGLGLKGFPAQTRKWTTVAVGLGCIPFIIRPIDHGVHFIMDNTLRRLYSSYLH